MKYYKVPEDELLEMLAAFDELCVLNRDGVDNWSWYMLGKSDYMQECYGNSDLDFSEAAEIAIQNYEEAI